MISKLYLLVTSALGSLLLLMLNMVGTFRLCGGVEDGSCMSQMYGGIVAFSPLLPLFALTSICYFLHDQIYTAWFKFARIWIPLSILLIFLAPEYSHDWMFRIEKGTVAFETSLIFIIVSVCIIGLKWYKLRET